MKPLLSIGSSVKRFFGKSGMEWEVGTFVVLLYDDPKTGGIEQLMPFLNIAI